MKKIIALLSFILYFAGMQAAGNLYKYYLLTHLPVLHNNTVEQQITLPNTAVIPHYQIPKGNVFCIMEDKVTRATGVWLKLGVH